MNSLTRTLVIVVLLGSVLGGGWYLMSRPVENAPADTSTPEEWRTFQNAQLGIAFKYPPRYLLKEFDDEGGERRQISFVLFPDTPYVRALLDGTAVEGGEGPPTINVELYQNDIERYTVEKWVTGTNVSNFKMGDGTHATTTVAGLEAWRYQTDGLYATDNTVLATPRWVVAIRGGWIAANDVIREDYEGVVASFSLLVGPGAGSSGGPNAVMQQKNTMPTATITTTKGSIEVELFANDAPKAVQNFVDLARKGFYNGVIFHRVIKGFMIQGGDPTGTGRGGPGYTFEDELNPTTESYKRGYARGVLAMANAGPNTNGSQFFIMHADYPLPHNYTIFGRVTAGMDVVDAIATAPTGANDRPLAPVAMEAVSIAQ